MHTLSLDLNPLGAKMHPLNGSKVSNAPTQIAVVTHLILTTFLLRMSVSICLILPRFVRKINVTWHCDNTLYIFESGKMREATSKVSHYACINGQFATAATETKSRHGILRQNKAF